LISERYRRKGRGGRRLNTKEPARDLKWSTLKALKEGWDLLLRLLINGLGNFVRPNKQKTQGKKRKSKGNQLLEYLTPKRSYEKKKNQK